MTNKQTDERELLTQMTQRQLLLKDEREMDFLFVCVCLNIQEKTYETRYSIKVV